MVAWTKYIPHLHTHTRRRPLPHLLAEQPHEVNVLRLSSNASGLPNLLELGDHDRVLAVALSMQHSEGIQTLVPALLASQPPRALGEEEQGDEQHQARNALDAPGEAEGGRALDAERAAVRDQVHDEDAPLDGPLLYSNDSAADTAGRELRQVHADLGAGDTDAETGDDAPRDQVADVLRRALHRRADHPDDTGDHEGAAAAEVIRQPAGADGADEGARRHGGRDPPLKVRVRTIEIFEVLVGADPC